MSNETQKEHSKIAQAVWSKLAYQDFQSDGLPITVLTLKDPWELIAELEGRFTEKKPKISFEDVGSFEIWQLVEYALQPLCAIDPPD